MKTHKLIGIVLGILVVFSSCEDYLKESPPGELAPSNLLTTIDGIEAVLNSAYRTYGFGFGMHGVELSSPYEYTGDVLFQTGGGMNIGFILMSQFQWTASNCEANGGIWVTRYQSIRDANLVIDNIDNFTAGEAIKKRLLAEARYIRAVNYIYLYSAYGGVPLRKSSSDDPELARSSDEDTRAFIESELISAAPDLTFPGTETQYGRATSGAALGFLARHYLNTHQWQKAADAAKQVMDLGYYALFPSYRTLFNVENEPDKNPANKEMIAAAINTNVNPYGTKIAACTQPAGFHYSEKLPEHVAVGIANWASHFRLYDTFIATFDKEKDRRFDLIIENYINAAGNTIDLTTLPNNRRTLKFFDSTADAASHGNDHPMLRYADILMMRAEALNEISGPNQESVTLLNQIRNRAELDLMQLSDFPTKESLRDYILEDRAREFYYEGLRRDDLIRHGKLISRAHARGAMVAAPHHTKFPIPQSEMDANPNMVQNPGYE